MLFYIWYMVLLKELMPETNFYAEFYHPKAFRFQPNHSHEISGKKTNCGNL